MVMDGKHLKNLYYCDTQRSGCNTLNPVVKIFEVLNTSLISVNLIIEIFCFEYELSYLYNFMSLFKKVEIFLII